MTMPVTVVETVDLRASLLIFSCSRAMRIGASLTTKPAPRSSGWVTLTVAMSEPT